MNAFYEHPQNGIRFGYRCFDRVLLNGLIHPFRNLVFEVGGSMEQVFQALIDRSRAPLDRKTILGYQRRPRYGKRKKRSAEWEVAVERSTYDLTIFKLRCGKLTLKIYTIGERVLRIEAMAHNTQQLDCGRSLENFPEIVSRLKSILERFMNALRASINASSRTKLWSNFRFRRRSARPRWVGSTSTRRACVGLPKPCWRSPPHPAGSPLPSWLNKCAG